MKKAALQKLKTLMEARTQIDTLRYEDVRRKHDKDLNQSERLRLEAMTGAPNEPGAATPAELLHGSKRTVNLISHAKRKRIAAESLVPALQSERNRVRTALKRELALKHIAGQVEKETRKRKADHEEREAELIFSVKAAKRARSSA